MAARATKIQLTIAAIIATSVSAWADDTGVLSAAPSRPSLAQPSPVSRVSGVTQFGMPGDHKYIFCEGADCPARTPKHFNEPAPTPPIVMHKAAPVYVVPIVEETAPAAKQAPKPKPKLKKRKARKPVPKHTNDCPVTK